MTAIFTVGTAAKTYSGECGAEGNNLTWVLDTDTGVLIVSGTGEMKDYITETSPWHSDYRIKTVIIEKGVTSVSHYAFFGCGGLTSVTIPDSLTSIGMLAFFGCSELEAVYINDVAAWCHIDFSFSENSNPLTHARKLYLNGELVTDLVIPEGTTGISQYAFYSADITSVIIPEGVTNIGQYAFHATDIKSVTIPSSLTSIGDYAFNLCYDLESVYISDVAAWCDISFTWKNTNPLFYAEKLYINGNVVTDLIIPDGVTHIKDYTFHDYTGINSITIPAGVEQIGSSAISRKVEIRGFKYTAAHRYASTYGNTFVSLGCASVINFSVWIAILLPAAFVLKKKKN